MVVLLVFREAASTRRTLRMATCDDAVKGSAAGRYRAAFALTATFDPGAPGAANAAPHDEQRVAPGSLGVPHFRHLTSGSSIVRGFPHRPHPMQTYPHIWIPFAISVTRGRHAPAPPMIATEPERGCCFSLSKMRKSKVRKSDCPFFSSLFLIRPRFPSGDLRGVE